MARKACSYEANAFPGLFECSVRHSKVTYKQSLINLYPTVTCAACWLLRIHSREYFITTYLKYVIILHFMEVS